MTYKFKKVGTEDISEGKNFEIKSWHNFEFLMKSSFTYLSNIYSRIAY